MGVIPSKRTMRTVTERHEYVLGTPIASEDVLRTIDQARQDMPARQKAMGRVMVSAGDEGEIVVWWEETAPGSHYTVRATEDDDE